MLPFASSLMRDVMVMVMVIYAALVRSHQSTSRVASASMRGGEHRSSVRHTHSATGDVKASSLESSPGIEESSLASRRRGRGSDTPSTRPERSALRLLSIDTLARWTTDGRAVARNNRVDLPRYGSPHGSGDSAHEKTAAIARAREVWGRARSLGVWRMGSHPTGPMGESNVVVVVESNELH